MLHANQSEEEAESRPAKSTVDRADDPDLVLFLHLRGTRTEKSEDQEALLNIVLEEGQAPAKVQLLLEGELD